MMKLWRRFGTRVIVGALFIAAFSAILVNLTVASLSIDLFSQRLAETLQWSEAQNFFAQCQRAPSAFFVSSKGARVWALNEDFSSAHKAAPQIERALVQKLSAKHESAFMKKPGGGGVLVQRVRESGKCSVIAVDWDRSEDVLRAGIGRAVAAIATTCVTVFLLAMFFIIRPLTHRIAELKERARAVGTDAYLPLQQKRDDEIEDIAHALNDANAQIVRNTRLLQKRNRALEQHLSDVAHDLRTPITALQLKLERALLPSLTSHDVERVTRGALADALYLESLCENLRFATTLREKLDVEHATCDLRQVASRVVSRLAPLAQLKNIELNVALPDNAIVVCFAHVVMERLLSNLVSNAIEHRRDSAGNVALIVSEQKGRFCLRVQDDGPGLAADILARVQGGDNNRLGARLSERGGSGLGLQIVCELAVHCGFEIVFKNTSPGLCVEISGELIKANA